MEIGRYTDDCSMSYCIADSFINNPKCYPIDTYDLMLRFGLWWNKAYNAGSNV